MNLVLVLPILIPLLTAAAALFGRPWPRFQRAVATVGAIALLTAALRLLWVTRSHGIQVTQIGGWPAPYGITLVADLFSAIMTCLAAVVGLAVITYSLFTIDRHRESCSYYPLLHVLLMGVCGAFLTGDMFNLYVWFEVMLIASFVLLTLGGTRPEMEGAIKYVTLNLMSSALFLASVGILYGMAGTLNMADLAVKLGNVSQPGIVTVLGIMFLIAFGIKAAIFPLFFWLPASYHVPPVAISAVFAGLLTKVGVYALIRVFTLLFVHDAGYTHQLILVLAGLTMVTGVLGAAAQGEIRRILSFHIVSQIGYMIMGLGLFTPLALAGSVFYIIHHILVKTNLFLVGGLAYRLQGTGELRSLGGLYRSHPLLALLFLIPALSLAGMPPLSGFFAKLLLVRAGLEVEQYFIVATALVVSLLTLYSMTKIWAEAFWKPAAERPLGPPIVEEQSSEKLRPLLAPTVCLASLTVAIGLGADWVVDLAQQASQQLLHPEAYIESVLGGRQ